MLKLGEQVRAILLRRGWLQADLATAMQVSAGRLSRILAEDWPSMDAIEKVSAALRISPERFDVYCALRLTDLAREHDSLRDAGREYLHAMTAPTTDARRTHRTNAEALIADLRRAVRSA